MLFINNDEIHMTRKLGIFIVTDYDLFEIRKCKIAKNDCQK